MINALTRLGRGAPAQLPESLEAFGIAGGSHNILSRLFLSHPPIPERIAALQRL
jgi:heat shock protein HtpX